MGASFFDHPFKVWDELNSEEESARTIVADNAGEAAIKYAEEDVDGATDGLYTNRGNAQSAEDGQPLSVRCEDGTLRRFCVAVTDYEPVYGLYEVTEVDAKGGAQ